MISVGWSGGFHSRERRRRVGNQSAFCKMGASTSEKLVYIPVKLYVEATEKPKYVCRQCDTQGKKNTVVMAAAVPFCSVLLKPQKRTTANPMTIWYTYSEKSQVETR